MKDTFFQLLPVLGFTKQGSLWTKSIGPARLSVDTKNELLIYPEDQGLVINERQTCNFSAPENFVVFECVHRLLVKGYAARHIELEPTWKVGHGASGGRADILIKDNVSKALLIIECKTAGREFDRAWKSTLQDGDQLFSYAQQISETQFLCLYTSEFANEKLRYQSHIIAHRDNEKYLVANPLFKSFKDATDVRSRFAVWRDTYKLDFTPSGIFEDIIQPYHIGKDKYLLTDLHPISASDQQKKYHEFATILRQHNVSGRENAFDKLVNLFLCKLVDETENPDDLKFYWKGVAYDTHFELLDRLQQLYQAGMGKFLGEDITYINESDVSNALRFIRQNPDATQRAVWNLFIQQKFFTNNDFSLIDVHNEKLFYQNAEVLLKILQMWQGIRLIGDHQHNQFLGDMFEGFLDQGVKQSEGQYFTPGPICRFLLMSLPLETLVKAQPTPPKAIDYACGAGHFLTELALQLKPLVKRHHPQKDIADYHAAIYGVEKEYRLSKIAKVSAFMYGQPAINICYGDALVPKHDAFPEIRNGTFDLLVANPPFSVRGFLETLPESERSVYRLTETIDKLDTANSIETFFLERAKQLLKPGGLAAIILPSSILSNGGTTYVRAREILLQSFDLVAIAEFGSGTFGKTGTNTVTLFLRRKATAPDTAEHFRERVDEWFKGVENNKRRQVIYKDAHLIEHYATHRGIAVEDYKTLLCGTPNAALLVHETFAAYRRAFDASTEIKNLKVQKKFCELKAPEQDAELGKRFLAFTHAIERDKLLHFILADQQPNQVLILKTPKVTDDQDKSGKKKLKEFLGYGWSGAKGDEGIKLIKDAKGHHLTPLYDEADRNNPAKLNHAIARNFEGAFRTIPPGLEGYLSLVPLADLLDFSRYSFEKPIALSAKSLVRIQSKWPLAKLGDIADVEKGTAITETKAREGTVKVVAGGLSFAYLHDRANRAANVITVSASGANAGYVNFWAEPIFASDCSTIKGTTDDHTRYLFAVLKVRQKEISSHARGAAQPHVYPSDLKELPIPVPDILTQQAIIAECSAVDTEAEAAQAKIEKAERAMKDTISTVLGQTHLRKSLEEICQIQRGRFSHRPRNDPKFFGGPYPFLQTGDVVHAINSKVSYTQTLNVEGLKVSKLFQPPVVLVTIAANIGDTAVLDYPACFTDSVVGLIPNTTINARFLELMMRTHKKELNDSAPQMAQKNINIEILRPIKIPVPPLPEQQRIVKKIEVLEAEITAAQALLTDAPARKEAILKKYL